MSNELPELADAAQLLKRAVSAQEFLRTRKEVVFRVFDPAMKKLQHQSANGDDRAEPMASILVGASERMWHEAVAEAERQFGKRAVLLAFAGLL